MGELVGAEDVGFEDDGFILGCNVGISVGLSVFMVGELVIIVGADVGEDEDG